jgi:hypothetical protein
MKRIIFITFCFFILKSAILNQLTLSINSNLNPNVGVASNSKTPIETKSTGSYKYIPSDEFKSSKDSLLPVLKFVDQYFQSNGYWSYLLLSSYSQIVSGINYSFIYSTNLGILKLIINYVPWTRSIKLISIQNLDNRMKTDQNFLPIYGS